MLLYNPTVSGSLLVTGSLTTTGTLTAQTLVVQTVTSSVSYLTGSTQHGSVSSNTHQFTGSVLMSGSVGIGTNTPDTLLTVAGTNQSLGAAFNTYGNVLIYSTDSYAINKGGSLSLGGKYNNSGTPIETFARIHGKKESATDGATSGYLSFETTNDATALLTERMRITSTGNVGIGTTSPRTSASGTNKTLDIKGGIYFGSTNTESCTINNDDSMVFNIDADNSNTANFFRFATNTTQETGGTELMRLTEAGNINLYDQKHQLAFYGAGNFQINFGQYYNGTSQTATNTDGGRLIMVDGGFNFNGFTGGTVNSSVTDTQRFKISGSGGVYVNTPSNPTPTNAHPQFGILAATGTDAINLKHLQNGNNTINIWQVGSSQHAAIAFYKGDSQDLRGNIIVSTSAVSYNTTSDYRLKENVALIENGIDRVMQLKPSKFNWIETGEESEGFIAHELQEIFPDAVTGEKDAIYSSTGNIKPQSVDYGRITPLLVKAIQELKAEIDTLKQQQ